MTDMCLLVVTSATVSLHASAHALVGPTGGWVSNMHQWLGAWPLHPNPVAFILVSFRFSRNASWLKELLLVWLYLYQGSIEYGSPVPGQVLCPKPILAERIGTRVAVSVPGFR